MEGAKEQYSRVVLDLGVARTNEIINIFGDHLAILKFTGTASTVFFRLNHRHNKEIYPVEISEVKNTPFKRIFLTNTAEPGKELVFGIGGLTIIIPATAQKVQVKDGSHNVISPAEDKRFRSHTFKQKDKTTQTAANTAEPLMAASTPINWAIIHIHTKTALMGDSSLTRGGGAHDGQEYAAGSYITLERCDLNEVYIINETVGEQVIFSEIYTEEAI